VRVLHVIESMGRGGAERNFATLVGPLAALGVENVVATLWSGHVYDARMTPFASRHDFGLQPGPALSAVPGLIRLARGVDVVHTQLPWADIVGRMAAVATGKPSVTTLHTTQYDSKNWAQHPASVQAKVACIRVLDAALARTTRQFFAVSPAVRDSYARALRLSAERIEIAPCVLDLDEFDPSHQPPRDELRERFGMAPDEISVIAVGRLVPSKRQADAIAAIAELAATSRVRLYLAGTGSDEAALRSLVEQRQAPVVFLGDRDDVPQLLHASDLFVFPTLFEGMPLALLEAMAMGKACICSDLVEIRQLGGDTVAYFPPGDVAELGRRLRGLIDDRALRARMGNEARKIAAGFADPHTAARRFVDKVRHIVSR